MKQDSLDKKVNEFFKEANNDLFHSNVATFATGATIPAVMQDIRAAYLVPIFYLFSIKFRNDGAKKIGSSFRNFNDKDFIYLSNCTASSYLYSLMSGIAMGTSAFSNNVYFLMGGAAFGLFGLRYNKKRKKYFNKKKIGELYN